MVYKERPNKDPTQAQESSCKQEAKSVKYDRGRVGICVVAGNRDSTYTRIDRYDAPRMFGMGQFVTMKYIAVISVFSADTGLTFLYTLEIGTVVPVLMTYYELWSTVYVRFHLHNNKKRIMKI